MRIMRLVMAWLLIVGLATPALAGDLRESISKAAQQQAGAQGGSSSKAYVWPGAALVIGGMAVAMYGFIQPAHRGEGDYQPNPVIGVAGLSAAAAGGLLLMVSRRHSQSLPTLTFGPGRVAVSKQLKW
jgi:hypothetical protein